MSFDNVNKVHFIGIGGIGVSAIARMMIHLGKEVSGSDMSESQVTEDLKKLGAKIYIGHEEENVPDDVDLVIYTIAIPNTNLELKKARELNTRLLTYPEALNLITKEYKTIAVSGTHGKTTTTAMLAEIFKRSKLNPTVIVGSLLKKEASNFIPGNGEYLILEACEYRRSFLNINPDIIVITNIDNDHLDYYKNLDDIKSAFREFVEKLPEGGYIVANLNDSNIRDVLKETNTEKINYPDTQPEITLSVPGEYNIENAKAAISAAKIAGIDEEDAAESLKNFKGTWRRFDFKGKTENGIPVYDDYAHHPTEIKSLLSGIKEKFPDKKITAVFQPHLFSRTKILIDDFSESFSDADEVIVAPIYAAREKKDESISSEILAEHMRKNRVEAESFENFEKIENELKNIETKDSVIITIGAGDIYKVAENIT